MNEELTLSPFERSIVGCRGIILRMDRRHAKRCAKAIRRRQHPAWSQLQCDFEVGEAA